MIWGDERDQVDASMVRPGRRSYRNGVRYHVPHRTRVDRPHRLWPAEVLTPPRDVEPGAKPKGQRFFQRERLIKRLRAEWGDKVKPARVTNHQWECRRLLEVELLTQVAAAKIMGIKQPSLREAAVKAGWVKGKR
jgi:hypothetical protein